MSERLTDEELARYVDLTDPSDPYPAEAVGILARELQARRAADLTSEDVEALGRLLRELKLAVYRDDGNCLPHYRTCVSVLDRLLPTRTP